MGRPTGNQTGDLHLPWFQALCGFQDCNVVIGTGGGVDITEATDLNRGSSRRIQNVHHGF